MTKKMPRDQIRIDNLVLTASIGVFEHEYLIKQNVRIDVKVDVSRGSAADGYDLANIVRYDLIVADIKAILEDRHIDLVETLAEKIASACLSYDGAVKAHVNVGKLDAIIEAESVGIRIIREKN